MAEHCNRFEITVNCEEGTETSPDQVDFIKTTSAENTYIEINYANLEFESEDGDKKIFKVKNSG